MKKDKLSTLLFVQANLHFLVGTLFLLQWGGVLSAPEGLTPGARLALVAVFYVGAVITLLRSMGPGRD